MAEASPQLFREALALDFDARAKLAELLLDSLEETDPEIDRLWLEEAKSRIAAYEAGTMKGLTHDEFFRSMKSS